MAETADTTRAQIIQAADDLFYGEGIRSASMDAIAARAGVTKRTVYYHFRSKDDLLVAYLAARDQSTLVRYACWVDESDGTLAEQIAGMFARLGAFAKRPQWKGCGFLRAAAELAGTPGHPARKAASAHKKRFEAWLAGKITEAGLDNPGLRARQLMILLDGTAAELLIHRDSAYAEAAGQAAALILGAHGGGRRARGRGAAS
jgi:AcrR family transcriptional regulator